MKNEECLASVDNVDNIVYLQNSSNQDSINLNFRSKLIGGLNEEDVKKYISAIEDKYQQTEQEMKELISSRNVLQEELAIYKTTNIEEKRSLLESLEMAQNDLAAYVDECKKKDLTLQASSDEKNSKIAQLQIEIKQMAKKQTELEKRLSVSNQEFEQIMESASGFEQANNSLKSKIADSEKELEIQRKISEKAEQELKLEKARSSNYKINGFKDEMVNIYQQLEHLTAEQVNINNELQQQLELEQLRIKKMEDLTEEQVNIINELQQQLEAEQLRTNKAENGLAELIKWVSGLKDKLCSEQNLFETKIKQLAERHDQFQSEISNCFLNLEEFSNI